eukprot:3563812-Amphidinium_carterae.1
MVGRSGYTRDTLLPEAPRYQQSPVSSKPEQKSSRYGCISETRGSKAVAAVVLSGAVAGHEV